MIKSKETDKFNLNNLEKRLPKRILDPFFKFVFVMKREVDTDLAKMILEKFSL